MLEIPWLETAGNTKLMQRHTCSIGGNKYLKITINSDS